MLPFQFVFSEGYNLNLGVHVFPAEKYQWLHDRLLASGFASAEDFVPVNGNWGTAVACTSPATCSVDGGLGSCQGNCTPGDVQCSGTSAIQTCTGVFGRISQSRPPLV